MRGNRENDIYRLIALHLRTQYRSTPFRFDLAGVNNSSQYSRGLYKSLNGDSGFPDLIIYQRSHPAFGQFVGCAIEVKVEGTRIRRKDGTLVADEHIREQAEWLKRLNDQGYYAAFGVGLTSCIELVDKYLSGTTNQIIEF